MSTRRLVYVALLAMMGVSRPAAGQPEAPIITMRIYDGASLPPAVATELRTTTESALAPTGIRIDWRQCADVGPTKHAACSLPKSRQEVVVRLVDSHDLVGSRHCGFALPTNDGGFISLSRTCASRTATRLHRSRGSEQPAIATAGEILGYALAHELAHLLLPGSPHSADGIFAGRLGATHWRRVRSGRLSFLPEDVERLRAAAIKWQTLATSSLMESSGP